MASADKVEAALTDLIQRLNGARDRLPRELTPLRRSVEADIVDLDVRYHVDYAAGGLTGLGTGPHPRRPDIRLAAQSDDVLAMAAGQLHPLDAYGTGRLRVEASLLDLLRLGGLA